MSMIGRIEQVPIREVWKHEAHDFTNWLATDGIDHLTDQLGLELGDVVTELPQGDLFADIVATDSEGRTIVIENQLERTDHGHLGQVITYLAVAGADAAIWISPAPRGEHVKSVEWLNEQTEADIWLVTVTAIRIGDSSPAPQFTVVAGPEISKRVRRAKQVSSSDRARSEASEFWDAWLPIAEEWIDGIKLPKTGPNSVFFSRRLLPGLPLNFHGWVTTTDAYAEVRIKDESEEVNQAIFDSFLKRKEAIEASYGGSLVWDPLEGSQGAKIDTPRVHIGTRGNPTETGMIEFAQVSERLIKAIKPFAEEVVAEGIATSEVSDESDFND